MHLFLGIEIPEETSKELYDQIESLRLKHPGFRWVEPKKYHVTVQFFGEVPDYKEIAKRLKDILYEAEPFYMSTLNLDTFVNKQITLYLDFYRQKHLEKIVKTVQADLGTKEERGYLPHITLSRSALSSKQQYYALKRESEKMKLRFEFKVDKLILYETILSSKNPSYNKLATFKLSPAR